MLIADFTIVSVLFDLDRPNVSKLRFLKDHDRVCFLSCLGCSKNRGDVQVGVVFDFLGVNDKHNVNILVSGESTQIINDLVLEVKLLEALCLVAEHELQVIKTDELYIIGVDCMLQ